MNGRLCGQLLLLVKRGPLFLSSVTWAEISGLRFYSRLGFLYEHSFFDTPPLMTVH